MNKLSIITINLNNAVGLALTMKSVWKDQSCGSLGQVEHILIDGESTDNSMVVAGEYSKQLAYIVFEKDSGVYNAMNKGIRRATGDYILFLNSGDQLIEGVLDRILFDDQLSSDILYGNVYLVEDTSIVREKIIPSTIDLKFFYYDTICHQAALIRTDLFERELYDESYSIVADWIFFFKRILIDRCTIHHLNLFLTKYDNQGMSNQKKYSEQLKNEKKLFFGSIFTPDGFRFIQESVESDEILHNIFRAHTIDLIGNRHLQRSIRRWMKVFWFFRGNQK